MAGKPGRRVWGWVRRLPSKQYQASYIHPPKTQCRHIAPHTFGARIDTEGWFSTEFRAIELGTWAEPAARVAAVKSRAVSLESTRSGGSPSGASSPAPRPCTPASLAWP